MVKELQKLKPNERKTYREGDYVPPVVKKVLKYKGWEKCHKGDSTWDLYWSTSRFKPSEYQMANDVGQKLNHFPKTSPITLKDSLLRLLRKMKQTYKSSYNFFPEGFILPREYTKFVASYAEAESKPTWICKPTDSSRGRKIFLIKDIKELAYDQPYIIQRYISNPLTIGGYKLDMRVYTLVKSFNPLDIYVYKNGIVRFATMKYQQNEGDLTNLFSHLTNCSINKNSNDLCIDKDVIGSGSKWDFVQFSEWMIEQGQNYERLWGRIIKIINLTLFMLLGTIPKSNTCFELFGFDIMIDENFKPWLIEVNCSPALGTETNLDRNVKVPLVNDMIDVLYGDTNRQQDQQMMSDVLLGGQSVKDILQSQTDQSGFQRTFPFNEESSKLAAIFHQQSKRKMKAKVTETDILRQMISILKTPHKSNNNNNTSTNETKQKVRQLKIV